MSVANVYFFAAFFVFRLLSTFFSIYFRILPFYSAIFKVYELFFVLNNNFCSLFSVSSHRSQIDMKNWKILFTLCVLCTAQVFSSDSGDDDDDGVTVEEEKFVSIFDISWISSYVIKRIYVFRKIQNSRLTLITKVRTFNLANIILLNILMIRKHSNRNG